MKKLLTFATTFKPLFLMYFAGGIILFMLWDLFFAKTGSVATLMLWEICAATFLLTVTHYLFYMEGVLENLSPKVKLPVHVILNYLIMFLLGTAFGWIPTLNASSILLFTGIFIVFYVIFRCAFYIYYRILKEDLNAKLNNFKKS